MNQIEVDDKQFLEDITHYLQKVKEHGRTDSNRSLVSILRSLAGREGITITDYQRLDPDNRERFHRLYRRFTNLSNKNSIADRILKLVNEITEEW